MQLSDLIYSIAYAVSWWKDEEKSEILKIYHHFFFHLGYTRHVLPSTPMVIYCLFKKGNIFYYCFITTFDFLLMGFLWISFFRYFLSHVLLDYCLFRSTLILLIIYSLEKGTYLNNLDQFNELWSWLYRSLTNRAMYLKQLGAIGGDVRGKERGWGLVGVIGDVFKLIWNANCRTRKASYLLRLYFSTFKPPVFLVFKLIQKGTKNLLLYDLVSDVVDK